MRRAIVVGLLALAFAVPQAFAQGWSLDFGLGFGGIEVRYPKVTYSGGETLVTEEETGFYGGSGTMTVNYFFGEKFGLGLRLFGNTYKREESEDLLVVSAEAKTTLQPGGGIILCTYRFLSDQVRPYVNVGLGGYKATIETEYTVSIPSLSWSVSDSVKDEDEGATFLIGLGIDFMLNDNWFLGPRIDATSYTSDDDDDTNAGSIMGMLAFGYTWE